MEGNWYKAEWCGLQWSFTILANEVIPVMSDVREIYLHDMIRDMI